MNYIKIIALFLFFIWFFFIFETKIKEEKTIKLVYIKQEKIDEEKDLFDFKSDFSITKYVSPNIPFDKINYIPQDLVWIKWDYIIDSKWNQKLRLEAMENLKNLSKDFFKNFQTKIKIISAYRSYDYQVWIKYSWCSDLFCAKAWYSEHQSWLAFDMFEASNKKTFLSNINYSLYYKWMMENATNYWFINSYQKWKEIDWYEIEPWHFRYIWIKLAKILQEDKLTFSEFYNNFKTNEE